MLAAVPGWWRRRAAAAGLAPAETPEVHDFAGVGPAAPAAVAGVPADTPVRGDLLDATPEALAEAYVVALDDGVRLADGRHYTPAPLASALYRQAVSVLGRRPDGLVWDPACGAGALLLPALRDWLRRNSRLAPEFALSRVGSAIGGCDLDAAAVWLGNVVLAAELLPLWARIPASGRSTIPALLTGGDGLAAAAGFRPQVVVLNPPYGRVRLTPADRERWAHVLYGHANRYGLFLAAAVGLAAPGGVVSALVPSGWLGGSYFQRLRRHLAEVAPLRHLGYVDERSGVFATGVLQETVLATFRKADLGSPAPAPVHDGGDDRELRGGGGARRELPGSGAARCERIVINGRAKADRIGLVRLPADTDGPWLMPRTSADVAVAAASSGMGRRLAGHGWTVSTGPLVWNRRKSRLAARPRPGALRVVWAADFSAGRLSPDPSRDRMRFFHPDGDRDSFLVLDRTAVLVQRTTAPEQPRRLLGAVLDEETLARWGGRVVVENHVNVLTCGDPDSPLTAGLLAALLRSRAADRLYRCLSGSVAVSAYELSALPIPDPGVVRGWASLPATDLPAAIDAAYGL